MPWNRTRYPANWNLTRERLLQEAGYQCQQCGVKQGEWRLNRYGEPYQPVLTIAHLDHNPEDEDAQLMVLCQACHCRYDGSHEQRIRKAIANQVIHGQMVSPLFLQGGQAHAE